jgi:hypothetical protein
VDLRMSRSQCAACLSDLAQPATTTTTTAAAAATDASTSSSASPSQRHQQQQQPPPWTMEAVVPRQFAPRMRKKRPRLYSGSSPRHPTTPSAAPASAANEELLSLRVGDGRMPPGVELWTVVPGATIECLGAAADTS